MNVTNFGWSVSTHSGSGIDGAILNVSKRRGSKIENGVSVPRYQRAELDGKKFSTSDLAFEAAAEMGYTVRANGRPSAFIHLRLSPATRRFLKPLSQAERVLHLMRIARGSACEMVSDTFGKPFMSSRAVEWMKYLDGKNPERKFRHVA